MSYRALQLCSSGGAYEALPDRPVQLDLADVRGRAERAGRKVVDARVMLVLPGEPEVTLTRGGKIVVKTRDAEAAQRSFQAMISLIESPTSPG
ncbi:MAG: hypothetical protein KGI98_03215 [Euryarchaeota archaeon]|nr:hypothetical protein [Euryarchaeota archaeon]